MSNGLIEAAKLYSTVIQNSLNCVIAPCEIISINHYINDILITFKNGLTKDTLIKLIALKKQLVTHVLPESLNPEFVLYFVVDEDYWPWIEELYDRTEYSVYDIQSLSYIIDALAEYYLCNKIFNRMKKYESIVN